MNIAILIPHMLVHGGTQRTALQVARYLQKNGHQVTVYAYWYDCERCYPELTAGLDVRGVFNDAHEVAGFGRFLGLFENRPAVLAWLRRAFEFGSRLEPDTDILYGWDSHALQALWAFKRRTGKPTLWCCLDLPGYFRVGFMEGFYHEVKLPPLRYLKYRISDMLNRSLDRRVYMGGVDDIVVHVSKNAALVKRLLGRSSHVIYPPVDTSRFTPRAKPRGQGRPFRVSSVAVFYRYRRFEDLIRAVGMLRQQDYDVELTIAGNQSTAPDYASELKDMVRSLKLEGVVQIHESLTEAELRNLLWQSDVFVWCNHHQSWGTIVPEAIASGTPVVVSDTSGVSEILIDHSHALIVPSLDPPALAAAVREIIHRPELGNQLVRQAVAEVFPSITVERHCEANLKLLQTMCS